MLSRTIMLYAYSLHRKKFSFLRKAKENINQVFSFTLSYILLHLHICTEVTSQEQFPGHTSTNPCNNPRCTNVDRIHYCVP